MHGSQPNPTWLRRVRALLAKAEATSFAPEAEALIAKAQELMTRYAIDEAMVDDRGTDDLIATRAVTVQGPYASAKSALLSAVCDANDCRLVVHGPARGHRRCSIIGHGADLDRASVLFTTLVLHATAAMKAGEPPDATRVRAYRHAFLVAFAARLGERLRAAHDAEWRAATNRHGGALAVRRDRRAEAVDGALAAQFPFLAQRRVQGSSASGLRRGRAAADLAGLGDPAVVGARSLPRAGGR